ncbi:MAG: thioredoxin [Bacteroidia bacterium]|nr:thioredoxin [Bacteroidia bacterium]
MKIISTPLLLGLMLLFTNCHAGNPVKTNATVNSGNVIVLTNETFKQKVFNYDLNKSWKYEGNLPAIVDFYADWCGPCRKLSPMVEELAKKYNGKIIVYKVDTDVQQQLAQSMGISNLPTLLFIPVKGQPRSTVGLVPNETLEKAINEVLLVK